MTIAQKNLTAESIQGAMTDLKGLNGGFWQAGHCKVHLKISHNGSEAIIELGNEYQLIPSTDNIKLLKGLFGDGTITIN